MTARTRPAAAPASATDAFFAELASHSYEPRLKQRTGSIRFDLRTGGQIERWHVQVDEGRISVTRGNKKAESVVTAEKAIFDGVCTGSVNALSGFLRGELVPDGDLGLVLLLQRLFRPPSPGEEDGRA